MPSLRVIRRKPLDVRLARGLAMSVLAVLLGLLPLTVPNLAAEARDAIPATGSVVQVTDGDTVVVRLSGQDERVRLLGIDAPEKKQMPWGPRAARFLAKLVLGKTVRVETDVQARDRYGRLLGYVFVDAPSSFRAGTPGSAGPGTSGGSGGSGKSHDSGSVVFVNLEMVRQGYAMLYTSPPNVAHADELLAAQREARTAGRNIWSPRDGLSQTPYEFRHHRPAPPHIGQDGLPNGKQGRQPDGDRGSRGSDSSGGDRPSSGDPPLPGKAGQQGGVAPEESGSRDARDPHRGDAPGVATRDVPGETSGNASRAGKPAAQDQPFIGNRRSRRYHAATCPLAESISPGNRVGFASAEAARAAGLIPCQRCGSKAH